LCRRDRLEFVFSSTISTALCLVPGLFYVLFGVRTKIFDPQMTSEFTSTYSKDVLRNRPGTRLGAIAPAGLPLTLASNPFKPGFHVPGSSVGTRCFHFKLMWATAAISLCSPQGPTVGAAALGPHPDALVERPRVVPRQAQQDGVAADRTAGFAPLFTHVIRSVIRSLKTRCSS
jgi:hypothetical protein